MKIGGVPGRVVMESGQTAAPASARGRAARGEGSGGGGAMEVGASVAAPGRSMCPSLEEGRG
jgi:hypothetical protein